jgi:hypothetical protein
MGSCSFIHFSKSTADSGSNLMPTKLDPFGNPNPKRYSLLRWGAHCGWLVLWVNYPDCTNYEGNKILVFQGCTLADIAAQGAIDPHFSESKTFISPVARFEPTERGWKWALGFVVVAEGTNG